MVHSADVYETLQQARYAKGGGGATHTGTGVRRRMHQGTSVRSSELERPRGEEGGRSGGWIEVGVLV